MRAPSMAIRGDNRRQCLGPDERERLYTAVMACARMPAVRVRPGSGGGGAIRDGAADANSSSKLSMSVFSSAACHRRDEPDT